MQHLILTFLSKKLKQLPQCFFFDGNNVQTNTNYFFKKASKTDNLYLINYLQFDKLPQAFERLFLQWPISTFTIEIGIDWGFPRCFFFKVIWYFLMRQILTKWIRIWANLSFPNVLRVLCHCIRNVCLPANKTFSLLSKLCQIKNSTVNLIWVFVGSRVDH